MHLLPFYIVLGFQATMTYSEKFGRPLRPSDGDDKDAYNKEADDNVGDLPGIMKKYHPQEKHLKLKKLIRRLGDKFDAEWMAITRPDAISDGPFPDTGRNVTTSEGETRALVQAFVTSRNISMTDSDMKPLIKFLSTLSSCTVRFEWTDLGELFWPRYVKSGLCTSENSCSWPSGMTCMPGELKAIHILRWRCKRRGGSKKRRTIGRERNYRRIKNKKAKKLSCSWKTIPYHVPVGCACSC